MNLLFTLLYYLSNTHPVVILIKVGRKKYIGQENGKGFIDTIRQKVEKITKKKETPKLGRTTVEDIIDLGNERGGVKTHVDESLPPFTDEEIEKLLSGISNPISQEIFRQSILKRMEQWRNQQNEA